MPTVACVLLVTGILLIYCEFIWVGRLVFGFAGSLLSLFSLSLLVRIPHSPATPAWLLAAVACFAIEARFDSHGLASVAGACLCAWGFVQWQVWPVVAIPLSLLFGGITWWLLSIARRARRNKQDF